MRQRSPFPSVRTYPARPSGSRRLGLARLAAIALLAGALAAPAAPVRAATLLSETTWGGTGSEITNGTAVAPDGSTYLAGVTFSFDPNGRDAVFLVKLGTDGTLTWQRTWTGPQINPFFRADQASAVAVAPDESVYVVGSTFGDRGDMLILKFSSDGSLIWQRRWGSSVTERASAVAVGADGSIYVVGGATNPDDGSSNLVVLKFAPDGSVVWQKAWGPSGGGEAVAVGPDGNIYVAGVQARPGAISGADMVLLKVDPAGNLIWQRAYSAAEIVDSRGGVAAASDGSVYVSGALMDTRRTVVVDAALVKFTADGSLVWDRGWGGRSGDLPGAVRVAPDGTVLWAGETNSFGAGIDDAYLLRMSSGGRALESNTWGGTGIDHGEGIDVAPAGTISLGATTETASHVFQRSATKTSRLRGTVTTPANAFVDAVGTAVDAGGTVATPPGTSPGGGGFDAALVRIGP
jgi:uncharacterized delta-60 repeat protein